MNLCSYHNALTSSWENPKGKAKAKVEPKNCDHCQENIRIIEAAGGPEGFFNKLVESFIRNLKK